MTTQWDVQLGIKKETVFGVGVTVDVFPEIVSEDFDWDPTFTQGAGMRVNRRVDAADRRRTAMSQVAGGFTMDVYTKIMGKFMEAALGGTGSSALVSGSAYQQLFQQSSLVNSYTIQVGIPPVAGGTTLPQTFTGMMCTGFEISHTAGSDPSITFNWTGRAVDTVTALATASYVSGALTFSFPQASVTLGGVVTVPTATALASGGTATSNVTEFNFTYENSLDEGGFNFGGGGLLSRKKVVGSAVMSGSITAEFDTATLRDAYLTQADLPLVYTLQGSATNGVPAISGAVFPAFQIVLPNIRLEGELPKSNGGDVITQSVDFTGLDNRVAASPIYVAIVTAETAI